MVAILFWKVEATSNESSEGVGQSEEFRRVQTR